jgi:hypothetical protein
MAHTIRRVEYYYANVRDDLGAAYRFLQDLAGRGVGLLAFTAVPSGPDLAQFALFPEDPGKLRAEARAANLTLEGPYHALLVQGDDELGALARVHERLFQAGIDVYASSGVTDGRGSFGYLVYLREGQLERAAETLGLA